MKGRLIAVSALGLVVIVLIWNLLFYSPAGKDVSKAHDRITSAQTQHDSLVAENRRLVKSQQNGTQVQAELAKLQSAVPATPDLEGFLRAAYDIKVKSGVDWVSIAPSEPTAGAGPSEISMQIVVRGGFFQVLDYLNRFGDPASMPRLVIIDGINITTAAPTTGSGSSSSSTTVATSGAPDLSVSLTARMFTQAAPTTGTGSTGGSTVTTPTTAATGGTTPTTSAGVSN